jgi:hypothetical protein
MGTTTEESNVKTLKQSAVSLPNSIYATKIFGKEIEAELSYNSNNTLIELWNNQHPLIHTWLLLSSVSICLLFTIFFIIQ